MNTAAGGTEPDEIKTDGSPRSRPVGNGWLAGIVLGILIGLWALPPVRYTLSSQFYFALNQDSMPWMNSLDTRRSLTEAGRLDAAAASLPGDYLLQVGRATALVEAGGVHEPAPGSLSSRASDGLDHTDRSLVRLTLVARQFSTAPGACAHLARYMMGDRVRIQRDDEFSPDQPPLSAPNAPTRAVSLPARLRDVKLMEWSLRAGERADPNNAFWPTMLATTYFAAGRDRDALHELLRVPHKSRWDAYIYEEVLGQWRLYSLAYGDQGALQKIGPLSVVAFPHLHEIRTMAYLARAYADRAAALGQTAEAVRLRHALAYLGVTMRDTASWAYEALYGTDLLLISTTESDSTAAQDTIRSLAKWVDLSTDYLRLLRTAKLKEETAWLYTQVQLGIDLRERLNSARQDASYPGIPPGIPLMPLFGSWMTGVCLVQQALLLVLTFALVIPGYRLLVLQHPRARLLRLLSVLTVGGIIGISGLRLFYGVPSPPLAVVFLFSATLLLLIAIHCVTLLCWRLLRREELSAADRESAYRSQFRGRWNRKAAASMLTVLLVPGLILLLWLNPILSRLHPVAVLLTNLLSEPLPLTAHETIPLGLLTCMLPLALAVALCLWGLRRRVAPLAAVCLGLRQLVFPTLVCLTLTYLVLLNGTLRADAEASRAINEAAQNDLHWVLTHSEPEAPEHN